MSFKKSKRAAYRRGRSPQLPPSFSQATLVEGGDEDLHGVDSVHFSTAGNLISKQRRRPSATRQRVGGIIGSDRGICTDRCSSSRPWLLKSNGWRRSFIRGGISLTISAGNDIWGLMPSPADQSSATSRTASARACGASTGSSSPSMGPDRQRPLQLSLRGNIIVENAPLFVQNLLMGDGDHFPVPVSIRNSGAEDR